VLLALMAPTRPITTAALLHSPARHVRTTDKAVAQLLKTGAERSYTFAHLLARLELTDVCVYVERSKELPHDVDGRMVIVPTAGPRRYVRILLADALPGDTSDAVALLAHELRHALEVSDAPEVRDEAALAALYKRIGQRMIGADVFDTAAAREAGAQVRKELGA
jgi:hypothetical protein